MIQSTQIINGEGTPRLIVVNEAATFESSASVTYAGNVATFGDSPDLSKIAVGMRLRSLKSINGVAEETHGKIINFDDTAKTIEVDSWTAGTPDDSNKAYVDGWVIDLPRCQRLTEYFSPLQLVHRLWRNRRDSKFQGWGYRATLDYSQYIAGETLASMLPALSLKEDDRLVLITRKDAPEFQYNILFDEGEIALALFGKSKGYSGPVFTFLSKEPLASWPILNGYGYGYGLNYGVQL